MTLTRTGTHGRTHARTHSHSPEGVTRLVRSASGRHPTYSERQGWTRVSGRWRSSCGAHWRKTMTSVLSYAPQRAPHDERHRAPHAHAHGDERPRARSRTHTRTGGTCVREAHAPRIREHTHTRTEMHAHTYLRCTHTRQR